MVAKHELIKGFLLCVIAESGGYAEVLGMKLFYCTVAKCYNT